MFEARVNVMLKPGIADPQGQTIERALPALGYAGVTDVRVGKRISLELEAMSAHDADVKLKEICERLLANPVIEAYDIEIVSNGSSVGDGS